MGRSHVLFQCVGPLEGTATSLAEVGPFVAVHIIHVTDVMLLSAGLIRALSALMYAHRILHMAIVHPQVPFVVIREHGVVRALRALKGLRGFRSGPILLLLVSQFDVSSEQLYLVRLVRTLTAVECRLAM